MYIDTILFLLIDCLPGSQPRTGRTSPARGSARSSSSGSRWTGSLYSESLPEISRYTNMDKFYCKVRSLGSDHPVYMIVTFDSGVTSIHYTQLPTDLPENSNTSSADNISVVKTKTSKLTDLCKKIIIGCRLKKTNIKANYIGDQDQ